MLAPLLFIWPLSIAVTHYFSTSVANYPYDQALREQVLAVARQVRFVSGEPRLVLSDSARALLRADEIDSVFFHVLDTHGRRVAGDSELPLHGARLQMVSHDAGEVGFRDDDYRGQDLRVAFAMIASPEGDGRALIEVAETLEKRRQLSNKIIASVILPQFVIIPLAVVLVWFGLSRGLRPLTSLRERIERRREGDLSPITSGRMPEELQPLTDAFNSMLARMQHNMEMQRRFISDAAHQMRTPLTGLKTQAQLAGRESDPESLRFALEQISASADRASHLVNQLLALARAEASEHVEQPLVPVDLEAVLRDAVSLWVPRAMARQIDLGYEAEGVVSVLGNAFLLREMFNNLLDNALRYTQDGGRVTARVLAQGDFALIEIEDNGIGLSEEDARKVFERFYRVEGTGVDGSGLGLAIVREIAELHQAAATLRPHPRDARGVRPPGAIARVIFPIFRPEEAGAAGQMDSVVIEKF